MSGKHFLYRAASRRHGMTMIHPCFCRQYYTRCTNRTQKTRKRRLKVHFSQSRRWNTSYFSIARWSRDFAFHQYKVNTLPLCTACALSLSLRCIFPSWKSRRYDCWIFTWKKPGNHIKPPTNQGRTKEDEQRTPLILPRQSSPSAAKTA